MAVLRPLRVVLTNYPEDHVEEMDVVNNPEDASAGTRKVPFSRVVYIERDDFMEDPPKKFFRLAPGREVRLRNAYLITCTERVEGCRTAQIVEVQCTYDPATRGRRCARRPQGESDAALGVRGACRGRRSAALRSAVQRRRSRWRRRQRQGRDFIDFLNPRVARSARASASSNRAWRAAPAGARFQFERLGYFAVDPDSRAGHPCVQPHRVAQGHLGEDRRARITAA